MKNELVCQAKYPKRCEETFQACIEDNDYHINSYIIAEIGQPMTSGRNARDLRRIPLDTFTPRSAYPFFQLLLARFGFVFKTSSVLIGLSLISQRSGTGQN